MSSAGERPLREALAEQQRLVDELRRQLERERQDATARVQDHQREAHEARMRAASAEFRLLQIQQQQRDHRQRLNEHARRLRDNALQASLQLVRASRADAQGQLAAIQQETSVWLQQRLARFAQQLGGLARELRTDAAPSHTLLLSELLIASDEDFLAGAYLTVMGRPADALGLEFHGRRLKEGTATRLDILRSLRDAPEGRDALVPEIDDLLALDRKSQHPLMGFLHRPRLLQRQRALVALGLARLAQNVDILAQAPVARWLALASPAYRQWEGIQATIAPTTAAAGEVAEPSDPSRAAASDGAPRDAFDEALAEALARALAVSDVALQAHNDRLGSVYYWVDHTVGYPSNSGIQRVVRGMARALLAEGVNLIPVKWDEDSHRFYPPSADELRHLERWNGPPAAAWGDWVEPSLANGADWLLVIELTTYLRKTGLLEVKAVAARAGLRVAGFLHDAIPWKLSQLYAEQARLQHARYMMQLGGLDLVFTTTELVHGELADFLASSWTDERLGHAALHTCALPGEMSGAPRVVQPKPAAPAGTPIRMLSVGSIEPRKNQMLLLQAFEIARARSSRPLELVLAGGAPDHPDLAERIRERIAAGSAIRWETGTTDERLRQLYLEADFTVYPSIEEGFGLPILESLWYARPCICRDASAMREVAAGGGCLTVDTTDADRLAEAILQLARDAALRQQLAEAAIARPFKTWADYGAEITSILAAEIDRRRPSLPPPAAAPVVPQVDGLPAQLNERLAAWTWKPR